MVDDVADGIAATSARVFADSVYASFVRSALAVSGATDLDDGCCGLTSSASAADISWRTDADHGPDG